MSRTLRVLIALTWLDVLGCGGGTALPAGDGGGDAPLHADAGADGVAATDGGAGDGARGDAPARWSVGVVDEQAKFKSRAALAVAPDGTVHLAYNVATSQDGWYTPSVWHARRQGDTWVRTEVAPAGGLSNEFPVIVVDSQSRPIILYNRAVGDTVDLFMVAGTGSGFAAPVNLTSTAAQDEFAPVAAIDSANDVHVLYQQRSGPAGSQTYDVGYLRVAGGAPSAQESVATGTAQFSSGPDYDLAVAAGGVHVVYCKPGDSTLNNVLHYRHRGASAWDAEERMTETDLDVWSPALGVDGSGTVHVAYTKGPSWSEKTLTYDRRSGSAWLGEQSLSTSLEDRSYYLGLQVEGDGLVHVAFHRFYDSNGDVLYRSGRDGAFGPEERVTSTPDGDEAVTAVARIPGGAVLVSYVENLSAAPAGKVYLATRE